MWNRISEGWESHPAAGTVRKTSLRRWPLIWDMINEKSAVQESWGSLLWSSLELGTSSACLQNWTKAIVAGQEEGGWDKRMPNREAIFRSYRPCRPQWSLDYFLYVAYACWMILREWYYLIYIWIILLAMWKWFVGGQEWEQRDSLGGYCKKLCGRWW